MKKAEDFNLTIKITASNKVVETFIISIFILIALVVSDFDPIAFVELIRLFINNANG